MMLQKAKFNFGVSFGSLLGLLYIVEESSEERRMGKRTRGVRNMRRKEKGEKRKWIGDTWNLEMPVMAENGSCRGLTLIVKFQ